MSLSVRLSEEDESLLEVVAQRVGRNKSSLVRQAVHELCHKLTHEEQSAYNMGKELFDQGVLSEVPTEPLKNKIWEKLHVKHGYTG